MADGSTKLSNLVNDTFTVLEVKGYGYKKWDAESHKMLFSRDFEKGYRKVYTVVTDKGTLDLGATQFGTLLEGISKNGKADIIDWSFTVKSNGKTGMDIRYFFNPVWNKPVQEGNGNSAPLPDNSNIDVNEEIDLSEIPF